MLEPRGHLRAMLAVLAAAVLLPSLAYAQSPPAPATGMGLRAFATFDLNHMAASQTFDAVIGTPDVKGFGGGVDLLRVWRNAFGRVALSRSRADGTRVIVFDDEAIPVGVATSIRMMPMELAGGWRFGGRGRLVPYGGGGLFRLTYEETTDFDEPGDDTKATFNGSLLFGGVDLRLTGALGVGAELQHRRLVDAIGHAGASAAFGENDLGGLTLRIWVGIGR